MSLLGNIEEKLLHAFEGRFTNAVDMVSEDGQLFIVTKIYFDGRLIYEQETDITEMQDLLIEKVIDTINERKLFVINT